jgi:hypothetical protein
MKLLTAKTRVQDVAKRWHETYAGDKGNPWPWGYDKRTIYGKLKKVVWVGPSTVGVVEEIIGNDSWTTIWCNNCFKAVARAVEFGAVTDEENSTAVVCEKCIEKSVKLLGKRKRASK